MVHETREHRISVCISETNVRPHVIRRYAQELNAISMFHLRVMLRQMLTKEGIPNVKEWEDTLLKLALQIAHDLTFTSHHDMPMSFSIDVRRQDQEDPRRRAL